MHQTNGFSLTEVLISLALITTISLALLHQQWQMTRVFNQFHLQNHALNELDSMSEEVRLEFFNPSMFQRTIINRNKESELEIAWNEPVLQVDGHRSLKRRLLLG